MKTDFKTESEGESQRVLTVYLCVWLDKRFGCVHTLVVLTVLLVDCSIHSQLLNIYFNTIRHSMCDTRLRFDDVYFFTQ